MEFYKIIDNLTVRFAVFLLNTVWIQFFIERLWAAIIISIAVTLLVFVVLKKIAEKLPKDKVDKTETYKSFVLMPPDELKKLYLSCSHDENYIKCSMRFSGASMDDVAAAYRESGDKNATLITSGVQRNVMLFAASLDKKIKFVTNRDLYKLLQKNSALPKPKTKPVEKPPIKPKEIVKTAFSGANAKYYLFSGVLLSISAFFTPFRIYYVVFASLSIVFAIVSLVLKNGE